MHRQRRAAAAEESPDGRRQTDRRAGRQRWRQYKHGFVTDIEQEFAPKGLNEDTVRFISAKKNEPEWMLRMAPGGLRRWLTMEEPDWAKVDFPRIDYQDAYYYAAPKAKAGPEEPRRGRSGASWASTRSSASRLREQEVLAGRGGRAAVAVDAVFDSVSVATTFRKELAEAGRDLLLDLRGDPRISRTGAASSSARSCRCATITSPA